MDFGGWFDLGGKHVAAPWSALKVNPDAKNVTLNVDKKKLRQAPSFERTYVPEMVERAWLVDMYTFYGAPPHPSLQVITAERMAVAQADTLMGMDVENAQGEELGEIKELAINLQEGRIAYAMLAYGGWLGLGENLAALPWEALKLNMAERQFTLMTKASSRMRPASRKISGRKRLTASGSPTCMPTTASGRIGR